MAILKKTSSGKGIQFIDDSGVIYPTSVQFLQNFIYSEQKIMSLGVRYAAPLPEGKFKKATVYDPTGYYTKQASKAKQEGKEFDSMKAKVKKEQKEEEQYSQVVTDF